jgi:hypothetical protein
VIETIKNYILSFDFSNFGIPAFDFPTFDLPSLDFLPLDVLSFDFLALDALPLDALPVDLTGFDFSKFDFTQINLAAFDFLKGYLETFIIYFNAGNLEPLQMGLGVLGLILTLALLVLVFDGLGGGPARRARASDVNIGDDDDFDDMMMDPNVSSESLEALAEIENEMMALKRRYDGGRITADEYVNQSRILFKEARKHS